jgi:transcriptional regulator with XRE-family HTH domain
VSVSNSNLWSPEDLGREIRSARLARGLSVSELARRSDLSQSFLSQVEGGESDISVGRLLRVTHALGIDVTDLLRRPGIAPERVVRADERVELPTPSDGLRLELLAPSLDHTRTNAMAVLEPGATVEPVYSTPGSETFVLVTSGRAEVDLRGGRRVVVRAGDSITYPAEDFVRMRNPGSKPLILVWVQASVRS